ncbi:MAG: hypothetical protein LXA50_22605, partial [Betaproteobacteria bacterium]|nr:hypothetical protein [Betaproteobacteria bacterium]
MIAGFRGRAPAGRAAAWLVLAVLSASLSPAADAQLFTDTESRKAIAAQRETIAAQQQQIAELTRQSGELSARINQLENALKAQSLLEVLNQVEALQAEMRKLRGQQEVLANAIDTAVRRQRDMYIDLDSRLKRLETATPPVPGAPPVVPGAPSPALPSGVSPTPGAPGTASAPASPGIAGGPLAAPAGAVVAPSAGPVNSSTTPAGRGPIVAAPAAAGAGTAAGAVAGTPAAAPGAG